MEEKETKNPGFSLKSANDSNYKQIVLDHYDSTREVILSATISKLNKSKVLAAYQSTKLVTGLVLPYVSNSIDNSISRKSKIEEDLDDLDSTASNIFSSSLQTRQEIIDKCTEILNNLTPLFSYIGLYVRTTKTGSFGYFDKK